jgi:Anti-sigma-K factor rskA
MKTPDRSPPPQPPDEFPALNEALGWNESGAAVPHGRGEAAHLEECVAAAALTAPRHRAPAHCLAGVKSRTARSASAAARLNGHVTALAQPSPWPARFGWGLAAALAALASWQTVRVVRLETEVTTLKGGNHGSGPDKVRNDTANNAGDERGPAGHADGWNAKDPFNPGSRGPNAKSRLTPAESMVVPDRPALVRQLEELRRMNESRFQPAPGLARTVVMELQPPGSRPGIVATTSTLSEEVASIIAAGLEKGKPVPGKPPLTVAGPDKDRPGDEIVIKEGLPNLSGYPLPEGVTLYHQDFPRDNWQEWEGLHLLKDGRFYDAINEILWKPVPGEGRYIGTRPQEPILLDEQAAPRDTAPPPPPSVPENGTEAAPPLMWVIYDESRGDGRLVVNDLPPPPAGKDYQLWFENAPGSAPVTAGLLPPLESGAGQVWFSLKPGISPMHYRLTLEPSGGSSQPIGPVILTGP